MNIPFTKNIILILLVVTCFHVSWAIDPPHMITVTDPPWNDEPADHSTFPPADLTSYRLFNDPDGLILEIPFASNWTGLQLHFLFEVYNDAAGASSDPFEMPVYYGHQDLPDFAMTCKYSSNDYGDMRRWTEYSWEYFDPDQGTYEDNPFSTNIQSQWTEKEAQSFNVHVPWVALDGMPDSLRVAIYLTQEMDGVKRSAFDSVPPDETLDLDFDYLMPEPGDWDLAQGPVTLLHWGPVYHTLQVFPTPPQIAFTEIMPNTVNGGGEVTLRAQVSDMGDGIGAVVVDFESLGGDAEIFLFDDGSSLHGDDLAGDGLFSCVANVAEYLFAGQYTVEFAAYDDQFILATVAWDTVTVTGTTIDPVFSVDDVQGDDHGPNQPGEFELYYEYPTSSVFVPGAFDLLNLSVAEVQIIPEDVVEDRIAFIVEVANHPDPSVPGNANWSPLYGDLNIQKIDIMIDCQSGGATASLPNRTAAFQSWDAWDYAIILDGWYKAVIPSLSSNDLVDWQENALRSDDDILIMSDFDAGTITAYVSPAALGYPTTQDILDWDIIVSISGHDGYGDLGGTRWVNGYQSEWNFGGGLNDSRDANLLDLLLVPGAGEVAGLPQEELLNHRSDLALEREAQGLTAIALAATMNPSTPVAMPANLFVLRQNIPNPFNPWTKLSFDLATRGFVDLSIYDAAGHLVNTLLAHEHLNAGYHEVNWNGLNGQGAAVAAGVYFYRLETGGLFKTRRMVLVK